MNRMLSVVIVTLLFFVSGTGLFAGEAPCPSGSLSAPFCDRNGDLLADPESNPNAWLDPYELVFGYTENQAFIKGAENALAHRIEQATGKRVRFFRYRTNAAQLEAMRSGLLHIVALNTGSVPIGVECSGFQLFAMAAKADRSYGYTMMFITYPGSGIEKIEDVRDQTVLFVTPTSNSGYKAPHHILQSDYGMNAGVDYRARFSGSHTKSILRVAHRQARIAAIADGVLASMIDRHIIAHDAVTVLYRSQPFPGTGYGYPYNLKPTLAHTIEEVFFRFRWRDANGTLREINRYHDARFIPAQYREKWGIVRDIDRSSRPAHQCR